jgi:hypothetical protein
MFEDGSAALWLALNPKTYSGPTEISGFQQGRLVNVIGSKHPLPGGVILKEVRGILPRLPCPRFPSTDFSIKDRNPITPSLVYPS